MKSRPIFLVLIFSILCGFVYAGTRGVIVLTDGSVVYGEFLKLLDHPKVKEI